MEAERRMRAEIRVAIDRAIHNCVPREDVMTELVLQLVMFCLTLDDKSTRANAAHHLAFTLVDGVKLGISLETD